MGTIYCIVIYLVIMFDHIVLIVEVLRKVYVHVPGMGTIYCTVIYLVIMFDHIELIV